MNMIYIVTMSLNDSNNECFIGLSKSLEGCVKCAKACLPINEKFQIKSITPTLFLFQSINNPGLWLSFLKQNRDWTSGTGWVVTKRKESSMSESIYALLDDKEKAFDFVNARVDQPKCTFREKCKITEVEGYKPMAKFLDENPELNRVHYTIYETEVEE